MVAKSVFLFIETQDENARKCLIRKEQRQALARNNMKHRHNKVKILQL